MNIIQPLFLCKFMIENESQHKAAGHSVFQISLTTFLKCVFPPMILINFPFFFYRCGKEGPNDRIVTFSRVLRDETSFKVINIHDFHSFCH